MFTCCPISCVAMHGSLVTQFPWHLKWLEPPYTCCGGGGGRGGEGGGRAHLGTMLTGNWIFLAVFWSILSPIRWYALIVVGAGG
jgi:hypothetical protein